MNWIAHLRDLKIAVRPVGAWLAILAILTSCDVDVFGRNKKRVVGEYMLVRFSEGGDGFYLERKGTDTQGGVFEAVIDEIGWSKDFIVCRVRKQFGNDASGIYSLEVSTGRVEGPWSESRLASDPRFREIKFKNVKKAYDRL
jgi:hypothetical protein